MTKEEWNNLVKQHNGEFLQSWDWGLFQEVLGRKAIRFYDEDLGLAQIIVTKLPLNLSWAYVPRGPIFFNADKAQDFINKIIKLIPANTVFITFELADSVNLNITKFKSRQPVQTLILDLTQGEAGLLQQMHAKTRYNINLAQKKDLQFKELDKTADFYRVLKYTSGRQGFRTYHELYFNLMKENLSPENIKFFGILHQNEVIASALFYTFGDKVVYLHGGSVYGHRALMAPYLLHWEAIKFFKSQGFKSYDFWGSDEKRWPGVTRFKHGFGGQIKNYPGAYVKILKPFWFKIYQVAKN